MLQKKPQLKWPFRDGAERDAQGYGPGTTFINVSSKQQPGVVDRYAGTDGRPRPITEHSEVYPGCFVRASLRPFTYDTNGSKGVSFGLQNLQKLRDGERIDGRMRPEEEFEAVERGAADLDDLLLEPGWGSRAGRAASGDRHPSPGRRDPLGRRPEARRTLGLRPAPEHRPVVRLLGDRRWRHPDLASRRPSANTAGRACGHPYVGATPCHSSA